MAGNGSSALKSNVDNNSSKPSVNEHNNNQPKPVSLRTRSTYPKRRRPHDQPPSDTDHASEAVLPPHRHDVCSAMEALHRGGGATALKPLASNFEPATPPPARRLRQTTNNVSSDDGGVGSQHREAPALSPAVSVPVSSAEMPTQTVAAKHLPAASGGSSCGRGSARKKSRLSLNRRRPLPPPSPLGSSNSSSNSSSSVVGTDGSNLGLRGVHESAAHGSPWRPSPQQLRQSPCRSPAAMPPPGEDGLAAREDSSVDALADGALGSMSPCSLPPPPPPPPFVGLENLGETCYVNAVIQALLACFEAVMPDGMAVSSAHVGRGGSTGRLERVDGSGAPSSVVPGVGGEGISVGAVAPAPAGGGTGSIGGDGNPVLEALGNLLKEVKERNRALSALTSGGADLPQLVAPQALIAPSLSEEVATHSEALRPTGVEGGRETAAMSETRRLCEPPPRAPDLPRDASLCVKAINPIALVDLIREGWLSAGRGSGGGLTPFRERHRERLADHSASAGFGSGQQCASELLGKLLDLPAGAGGVPSGGVAAACSSRGRDGSGSSTSGLIEAFRGALCARTTCVECERDRATREEFTELTLPPLLPQHPPSSPNRAPEMASASAAAAANDHPLSERLTLEDLVDAVLGSETLDGNSKVWCDACRQWTEAKRRFSMHSPPPLLALHIRPATGGQPIFPPPPAVRGGTVGVRGSGPLKARGWAAGGVSEKGEGSIERVLTVKGAAKRGSHETVRAGAADSCRSRASSTTTCTSGGTQGEAGGQEDRALEKLGDSEDVRYELVGIVLHKGQTVGSGHYTFARHTGASSSRAVGQCSRQRPHHVPSAPGVGEGEERRGAPPREAEARSTTESASASAMGGVHGSVGEGGGGNGVGVSTSVEAFALFDDACVRWLSPEEEFNVFSGGGPGGGLGEAFLVFYARRP